MKSECREECVANISLHPTLIEWIRDRTAASFICLTPKAAKPYVDLDLIATVSGELRDFNSRKPSKERLYRLTQHALQVAYPDGALVRKYKCTVCGKITAGRMSGDGRDETGDIPWCPRKHRVGSKRGAPVCPGTDLKAEYVEERITF